MKSLALIPVAGGVANPKLTVGSIRVAVAAPVNVVPAGLPGGGGGEAPEVEGLL
jgi:hypothetical protein